MNFENVRSFDREYVSFETDATFDDPDGVPRGAEIAYVEAVERNHVRLRVRVAPHGSFEVITVPLARIMSMKLTAERWK